MLKTTLIAAGMIALTGTAMADPYPAPPTAIYHASTAPTCNPVKLQVYFQNGAALLSENARRSIDAVSDNLDGCALAGVKLVAISADGRTVTESETLANQRIAIVSSALGDQGLAPDAFTSEINMAQSQTVTNRPMARRVEVTFAAYRPAIG